MDAFVDNPPSIAQGGHGVVVSGNQEKDFETAYKVLDQNLQDAIRANRIITPANFKSDVFGGFYGDIRRNPAVLEAAGDNMRTSVANKDGQGKTASAEVRNNEKLARRLWGNLSVLACKSLDELTKKHRLSIAAGDLQLLNGHWYITHSGLLLIAQREIHSSAMAAAVTSLGWAPM
jgi:hypothetical protein